MYSAQFISFCSRQNCWLVKFVFLKTGVKIAVGFKISPWDCFCCKPTTVSQGKFPEISDILQHAVQLLDEYWRRVCEIAAQPHFSQLSFWSYTMVVYQVNTIQSSNIFLICALCVFETKSDSIRILPVGLICAAPN